MTNRACFNIHCSLFPVRYSSLKYQNDNECIKNSASFGLLFVFIASSFVLSKTKK